jgi:predicted transcriptional regulator
MGTVFRASNLLEENFIAPTIVPKINIEESYFIATLNYLEEMDNEIVDLNKTLYKSLLESGDNVIAINESFSSFCESIKKVIERFLEFLKRIIQKFILTMNKIVKSDKYITKHKSDLDKFGPDQNFEMKMYIFTHLNDDNVPKLDPYDDWKTSEGYSSNDPAKLLDRVTTIYNAQKDKINGGWYDTFRAAVINNSKGSISSEDFPDEIFQLFRNDSKEKTDEEISNDKVVDAYNRFAAYDKNLKHVNDCKKKLEIGYNDIKKEIENWSKAGTDGKTALNVIFKDGDATVAASSQDYKDQKKEVDEQLNLFIKSKVNQIDHMCKIHGMVFSAKLDAIKDCYSQDKTLLYKALNSVQKIKKEV